MIKITPNEIKVLSKYIYDISGIFLDEKKAYLLETRLKMIMDTEGFTSYQMLYQRAISEKSGQMERKIINAVSTNETLFFRDKSPFEMFKYKVMPDLIDKRTAQASGVMPINIRIWSAACSTGQEIYSLAIILRELIPDQKKYRVKLLGTDISDDAVAQASYGKYNRFEIERGLEKDLLQRYFVSNGNAWKIRDDIRAMAVFQKRNLMEPFTGIGQFDIVFCRNVAIYFSIEDRKRLFEKIAGVMAPDGYLIIGSTESLTGICPQFEPQRHLRSVFYTLKSK
ncbi:MAG: protein-glutamate O-methyltransferase CheR [Desulfatiglans sp.]|jgi:chemotaxis protein methyltransferase CheR|nr:protein-glutamate O-methyltransferase CheR [Desulfatiglans sp.]